MRRKDREITGKDIEAVLEKGEYGILSTVGADGMPYALPISYAWKNGKIHLHCAKGVGKKVDNITNCQDVCFVVVGDTQVQPESFATLYESVIVTGKIAPAEDKKESLLALIEKYSSDFLEKGKAYIERAADNTGVYEITPSEISGKAKR